MAKRGADEDRGANGKLRQFTYQPRKQYPLRLPRDVYDRLSEASEAALMPNTMYVSTLLELWLVGKQDVRGLEVAPDSLEDRVTVTIRFLPSLFGRIQGSAKTHGVSLNRLITFILDASLRDQRSR